jgi:hypothetical protein
MVLGTTALTMIYQPGIDLATVVRRGWAFVAVAAGSAAVIAAVLALRWKGAANESRMPAEVQCVGRLAD